MIPLEPRQSTSRTDSFRHAFAGWRYVIRSQRNAWIHALATVLAVGLSTWLRLDRVSWGLIVVAISLVWVAEFTNTALEAVVDLASPDQNHLAKVGKDVGAAAVLIAAGTATLIGIIVLGPPLWSRIFS